MGAECDLVERAVVLLSGGLDSLVSAHLAASDHQLCLALTCDYGQRAAEAEMRAAGIQAARLGIPQRTINLQWLGDICNAALTQADVQMPHPKTGELDDAEAAAERARQVWVPNRNAVLLMAGAAHAEALECGGIVAGFNAEEAATFSDNRAEFVEAANHLLEYSAANRPRVICPTLGMTKTEMVQAAVARGVDLCVLHSCYEAGPRHCWQCESCRRLQRALTEAGQWETVGALL